MNTSTALMLTVFLSPVISSAIWFSLSSSLRSSLDSPSDEADGIQFWVVFAALQVFIVPLLSGLIIGVGSIPHSGVFPATGMTRVLASILAGGFAVLTGIGMQLAKYHRNLAKTRLLSRHNVRGEF